jgi:hypothetical protein
MPSIPRVLGFKSMPFAKARGLSSEASERDFALCVDMDTGERQTGAASLTVVNTACPPQQTMSNKSMEPARNSDDEEGTLSFM